MPTPSTPRPSHPFGPYSAAKAREWAAVCEQLVEEMGFADTLAERNRIARYVFVPREAGKKSGYWASSKASNTEASIRI